MSTAVSHGPCCLVQKAEQVQDDGVKKAAEPLDHTLEHIGTCSRSRASPKSTLSCKSPQYCYLYLSMFYYVLIDAALVSLRLEAALLQTTWSQTELNIQNDMNALRGWADKFKLFASQQALLLPNRFLIGFNKTVVCWASVSYYQGGLDLQYLSTRFQKGKDAVANYMSRRHVFGSYKNLMLAQGEIVEKQAALGKSSLLSLRFGFSSRGRILTHCPAQADHHRH